MTALASLAERLSGMHGGSLDDSLADTARQRVFDTLGATAIGLATAEGSLLSAVDVGGSASDRCRLFIGATRATEIDDIDIRSCTTVGSVVVPAALTWAAARADMHERAIDDRRLLTAIVAGYEAMTRLGRAIDGAKLIYEGVWPTYATAAFACAATVTNLMRLDTERVASALGIALSRVALIPHRALAQPAYRHFALGAAAVDGWAAAHAAEVGLTTADDSLESFAGSINAVLDELVLLEDHPQYNIFDVDTKCFPTSRQALASVEAFSDLLPLDVSEVESIDVFVPAPYRDMVDQPGLPATRIASMVGVQYQMALAATDSASFYDALRATLPRGPKIEAWMAKVRVHADATLTRQFPAIWGSRVIVQLASGRRSTAEVLRPAGSAQKPLGWPGLQEKIGRILAAGGLAGSRTVGDLRERCESIGRNGSAASAPVLLDHAERLASELRLATE